jgi:hypothetical protein
MICDFPIIGKKHTSFFQGLEGFKGKVPAVANFGLFPAGGMGNMGALTYEIYTVLPSSFSHGIQPAR